MLSVPVVRFGASIIIALASPTTLRSPSRITTFKPSRASAVESSAISTPKDVEDCPARIRTCPELGLV